MIMATHVQTITLAGERFVILPEAEYRQLAGEDAEPTLPEANANGNYPAVDALRTVLARKFIRRRRAAGLTQMELAKRADIRPETLNRLEQGKHTPTITTINKIDRVLKRMEKREAKR
jgi:DNA-binding XRE family transcriptional regulator